MLPSSSFVSSGLPLHRCVAFLVDVKVNLLVVGAVGDGVTVFAFTFKCLVKDLVRLLSAEIGSVPVVRDSSGCGIIVRFLRLFVSREDADSLSLQRLRVRMELCGTLVLEAEFFAFESFFEDASMASRPPLLFASLL